MKTKNMAAFFAIAAAALYAVNVPLSKILLTYVDTVMMAGLLYLGAGIGMLVYVLSRKVSGKGVMKEPLTRKELPYTIAMVVLDIAAPILLMCGVARTSSANVSLLNNFEIVATAWIALLLFGEKISRKLWIAISLITVASILLSFEGNGAFVFNQGSLCVLGACIFWGLENNCTRMLSNKSSEEIVIIKGIFSGAGSVVIALARGESFPAVPWLCAVLLLGFVAYGLSINFYIMAQKELGAAKTSAYYSTAPFLGVLFSMVLLGERPGIQFYAAFTILLVSTVLIIRDNIAIQHTHEHTHVHTHEHRHGNLVHTHEHSHIHSHQHIHGEDTEDHEHTHDSLEGHDHVHGREMLKSK